MCPPSTSLMPHLADLLISHVPISLPPHLTSFIPGSTPFSTTPTVLAALSSYLAVIFGIQAVMKSQKPLKLTLLFQIHNVILSAGSLILLFLMLEEIMPMAWHKGFLHALCSDEAWTRRLEFYYMINYYFKYLELVDTIFLAFKKKPLAFLHVFHHSATALLCYTQLLGKTSISWAVITLNLTVHVIMYYYYYATAGGAKIWWKKYLTSMQITQFVIDLCLVYFGTYGHFVATYYDGILPHVGNCAGTETAAVFGCALLTSYLGLFINFYLQTYKSGSVQNSVSKTNGYANGRADAKRYE